MIPALLVLWRNPLFKWACVAIAVAGILFAASRYFIHMGVEQGREEAKQETAKLIADQAAADRKQTQETLAQFQVQINVLATQVDTYRTAFTALANQRQNARVEVAGMTPAQVDAQINAYLGRLANDSSPYSVEERRRLADCTRQLPLCEQQVTQKSAEAENLAQQNALKDEQYKALSDYTTRLEGKFTDLWNTKASKQRSWKCLKLWHCSKPKIVTPDPILLQRPGVR